MNYFKNRKFSEKLSLRLKLLWFVLILMLIYMVFVGELQWGDTRVMTTLAENVSRLIFFGGLFFVINRIIYYKKILNNKKLLLAQSKREEDERRQFLHDKSGGVVVDMLLVVLLFTTCTMGLINMPAFNISLTILMVTIGLKMGIYVIYNKIA